MCVSDCGRASPHASISYSLTPAVCKTQMVPDDDAQGAQYEAAVKAVQKQARQLRVASMVGGASARLGRNGTRRMLTTGHI
jgi:hypothetical protein